MAEPPAQERPEEGRASKDVWRRRQSARRIVAVTLIAGMLAAGGWVAWYVVQLGSAANEAYHDIFVTPAPRPSAPVTSAPRPSVPPTTIRSSTPTATPTEFPEWRGSEPVTVLLVGIDTTPERAGAGSLPLADAIILAQLDPVGKRAVMLSIPRDLLVEIPGIGWDRINAAYAAGEASGSSGPALLVATIERNFAVHVDGFAEVDFAGFVRIVDLLGGIVVDVPAPIKDDMFPGPNFSYQRLSFAPGLQWMDGSRALAYVRTRHDDNDLARGLRQQQVLRALWERALRLDALRRAPQLLAALGDAVRTDLTPQQVLGLARLALELDASRITSASLAGMVQDATLPSGAAVLLGDWPAIRTEVARLFGPPRTSSVR